MVFSSGATGGAASIAPLDRAAMARPLPQPHVQRHSDDDDERHLSAAMMARGRGTHVKSLATDYYGPLSTLAAAVDVAALPRLQTIPTTTITTVMVSATGSRPSTKKTKKTPLAPSAASSSKSSGSPSVVSAMTKTTKKLSTERSRLCRQRQKNHADVLEHAVAALRAEVANLVTRRDLYREQLVHTPASRSGSLARIVEEYCAVFEYGMTPEQDGSIMPFALTSRKRSLASTRQLTAQEQCDFLLSIMDPEVQVFDWIGRTKRGPAPLVHGWKAWSAWHASIMFHLESVDVIEANDETIAVSTRGKICVKVSRKTIEQLFPHVASDDAICARLLGSEIRYPFRDTFYFNEDGRVAKYTVDMDCITALTNVVGDFRQVASLVSPPDDVSFNDRAVCTYEGCSLDEARAARVQELSAATHELPPRRDQRLDLQFLLS